MSATYRMRGVLLAPVLGAALLAGCGSEEGELRAWMDEVRRNTPAIRDEIAEPKRFEPFRYENLTQVDPFSMGKLQTALDRTAKKNVGGLQPDTDRRREALEQFPLESIRMVGHLASKQQQTALLQVDSMVYQARVGMYAGQNFGKIIKVSEGEVTLKELVQDASGEWVERESSLRLQESKK